MLDKIIEIIMTILPFLGSSRKKRQMMAQEVKEMHAEIFSLRGQLTQAAALQCSSKECVQRVQMVTETEG